jgi:outer membrane protein TolC
MHEQKFGAFQRDLSDFTNNDSLKRISGGLSMRKQCNRKSVLSIIFMVLLWVMEIQSSSLPVIRVGTVVDGLWQRNQEIRELIHDEILNLTRGEFDVRFPEEKFLSGNWSLSGIRNALDILLADPDVDFVLAMGVVASASVSTRGPLPKPVIAPFVIDADIQGLPSKDGASGVKNLCYLAIPSTIKRDLQVFLEIVPFKKLGVLVNPIYHEALSTLQGRIKEAVNYLGVDPVIIPVKSVSDAVGKVVTDSVEAVYVAPLLHLPFDDFDKLISLLIENKLPSFSLFGRPEVEQGILAGLNPDIFPRLSRRVALNFQKILLGQDPGIIPYAFAAGEELAINMATARAIELYPPWSIMTEAVLINEKRSEAQQNWTLVTAVLEGIEVNLDLRAKNYEVSAGKQVVNQARSPLLPQVDLSAQGVWIDKDRAGIFQAERAISGNAGFSQVLYSEDAWANYSVQKKFQLALEEERNTLVLDITQEVTTAYLSVLIANTIERIQKVNLRLSRENLELARVREAVGYSGRAEVFRWEREIANNRQGVIEANASRNLAEIQLNRLLHRPSEESFTTQEKTLESPEGFLGDDRLFKFMENQWYFRTLRGFFVEEGIRNSPEAKQIDANIAAQRRILSNASRSFFLPELAAFADLTHRFWKDGVGSEISGSIPGFTIPDNTDWTIGLSLSIPMIEGGRKIAARAGAIETLYQLRSQRQSIVEKIEQRVRSAAHLAGASYAAINQFRQAADASRKNLELVIDSYSQGVVSITDLIDAQNAAVISEATAANAVFNFLIDLMELERSLGQFHFRKSPEEKDAFFNRLNQYFEKMGVEVK